MSSARRLVKMAPLCEFDVFAIFPSRRRRTSQGFFQLLIALIVILPSIYGGCEFPAQWAGKWFQSGVQQSLIVNSSHIETKGECYESQGDKFLLHDRGDNCYRCIVIHEKHPSVLQYKETYCDQKAPLNDVCEYISGDAPLFSMFRQDPPPKPQPCPFKSAPFTFSYNRGSGDCVNPPSRADSCTDDSRLLLNYQACPDIASTESNVEELVCLATWKEGSTRYLVGKLSQLNRRMTDEDSYRCFVYKGNHHNGKVTYDIAQSGDATCNGLVSTTEGGKMLKLTTVDNHHNRCRFPSWITEHHTWHSLDHSRTYHFSLRNATLKISNDNGSGNEMRLVCHSILLHPTDNNYIQIVAHITRGCNSGHICMMFYRRDNSVIEVQQTDSWQTNPDDACQQFDSLTTTYTTLITATLHPKSCPQLGRFTVYDSLAEKRKRRQQLPTVSIDGQESTQPAIRECPIGSYESLAMGCTGSQETLEFKSSCSISAYSCHGSWTDRGVHYLIASPTARASTDPRRYCFMYTMTGFGNDSNGNSDSNSFLSRSNRGRNLVGRERPTLHLSAVAASCSRTAVPGVTGDRAYNLTMNGTCAQSSEYNSRSAHSALSNFAFLVYAIPVITTHFLYPSFLR
ncbi:uncharacterized protein LOC143909988 [Arctopsyche grandis]|uniref:uncharacterized protein LOC143909988 n=1 Tax=Arctopsyche grandis TaxID=121162 RepID=UPI00406D6A64